MSAVKDHDWECAGCGVASPDRRSPCDCPTQVVVKRQRGQAIAAWKFSPSDAVFTAAPDLLEALSGLMKELEASARRPSMIAQNRARAAIAKATGQSHG